MLLDVLTASRAGADDSVQHSPAMEDASINSNSAPVDGTSSGAATPPSASEENRNTSTTSKDDPAIINGVRKNQPIQDIYKNYNRSGILGDEAALAHFLIF
jgi:hypothetical protein